MLHPYNLEEEQQFLHAAIPAGNIHVQVPRVISQHIEIFVVSQ